MYARQTWWVTAGSDGFTSIDVTHVSSLNGPGTTIHVHSTIPFAGTSYVGPSTRSSGLICQPPSGQTIGCGASFGLPAGAPASAQATSVSTSAGLRERSLRMCPAPGSANHGGIFFESTAALIARAYGRVPSYV